MKTELLLLAFGLCITICKSQNVNIPDANFKAYLVGRTAINTNGDGEIQVSEATAFTGTIDCSGKSIASLTGIETFKNIKELNCNYNNLTSLDVSKNTALTALVCDHNQLTSLDVSKNIAITYLYCDSNQLTSLDVSKNNALAYLYCSYNQLTSLDVSKNTVLYLLDCSSNHSLTSLDVSKNTALNYLDCQSNQLVSLDLSKNAALTYLYFNNNLLTNLDLSKNIAITDLFVGANHQLTSLDVSKNIGLTTLSCNSCLLTNLDLSKNIALQRLECYGNQLTSLDLSKNTGLTELYCYSNQLTKLNLKNGNNIAITYMSSIFNPNLTCIQVDNATGTHFSWYKDTNASYSTNCNYTLAAEDITRGNLKIYPNPTKSILNFTQKANVKAYNTLGQKVAEKKQATSLNISKLPKGIYIIVLSDDNGREIQKSNVIKE